MLKWLLAWSIRYVICLVIGCALGLLIAPDFARSKATSAALNSANPSWTPHAPTIDEYIEADIAAGVTISLMLLLPVWAAYRFDQWRKRASQPGVCRKCGYDLTGNVSGVCPECGEKVSSQHSA